jgi:hypothetical protein
VPRQPLLASSSERVYPTCDYPILPRNEAAGTDGHVGEFECLDDRLGDVRPNVDVSCRCQCPAHVVVRESAYRYIRS